MDAGLNVFEPNRSNLEPWKDGIKACNKLMKKNVKERLNMANEIWQRYEDNLEEVSKRKVQNFHFIISKAIKYEISPYFLTKSYLYYSK